MNRITMSERGSVSRVTARLKLGVLCSFTVLAAPAASTCGPPPVVDMTGTWVQKVTYPGQMTVPTGPTAVNIETTTRLVISRPSNFVYKLEICKLATPTTPNPDSLVVTYGTAALATMVATASGPASDPAVGGTVTIPQMVIQTGSNKVCTGSCVATDFIDSDGDGQPGITLPSVLAKSIFFDAYVALTTTVPQATATLQDANTMVGTSSSSTAGQVLRFNPATFGPGPITVVPTNPSTPSTMKRATGGVDVSCSTVLQQFP